MTKCQVWHLVRYKKINFDNILLSKHMYSFYKKSYLERFEHYYIFFSKFWDTLSNWPKVVTGGMGGHYQDRDQLSSQIYLHRIFSIFF